MAIIATLCTGIDGVGVGAKAAGLTLAWGVEIDHAIAEIANANLGSHVRVANLLACDPMDFDEVDILHASPPCPNFSVANANGSESVQDRALAWSVAEFIAVLQPRIFTLENVWAYRNSQSWAIIQEELHRRGYWVAVEHVNAANVGVPQTRKRMIVRAIRGGFVPYLPEPLPWVGWYAAIEDMLDTLPESQFAPWQLARLPELLQTVLVPQQWDERYDLGTRKSKEPAFTVTANHNQLGVRAFLVGDQERQLAVADDPAFTVRAGGNGGAMPRAILVDSKNVNQERGKLHRTDTEPSFTVVTDGKPSHMPRAWLIDGANTTEGQLSIRAQEEPALTVTTGGTKHPLRSLLDTGRVVAMTPRALARFQSFPDDFELPDNARLAAKGIGNAVPPLLYQRIIEPLLEGL